MGLYDSFLVKDVKCPSCNKIIEELEIQFKLGYPRLETFRAGEYFVKEKSTPGVCACPHCKAHFDTKVFFSEGKIVGYAQLKK